MKAHADKVAQVDRCLAGLLIIMDRSLHADSYWPIFDWLEHEREALMSRESRLQAARARASRMEKHGNS